VRKKYIHTTATILNWLGAFIYLCLPLTAWADTPDSPALPPVVISEVQMGSASSASEEFIELYNASPVPIDFSTHNWRIEIASSSASSWVSPLRTISLYKALQPGRSYIVASQYTSGGEQVQYLPDLAVASFSSGLTYTGGHIRLLYDVNQPDVSNTCVATSLVVDEFEWTAPKGTGTTTQSLDLRQQYVSAKASGIVAGTSVQRQLDPSTHIYADTNNDAADFTASTVPTPGVVNTVVAAQAASSGQAQVGLPADTCSPNPPAGGNNDEGDEDDDSEDPGQTGSETAGGDDSAGQPDDSSDEPATPITNAGLLSPAVTELLPNPGSPQTDAADEFIELYNPNQSTFNLSGYQLQVGTSSTHAYTFPADTQLAPGSYTAFFSVGTGLSLSNSGGQVKLLNPSGVALTASDTYGAAKDNQAWAVVDGKWQWTLSPTPNAANKLAAVASAATAKTTPAKKAATKTKAATAAKTKTTKAKADTTSTALVADTPTARSPVHPAVLAIIGVAAVLYGAYEYRQDVANYFRRLRENRAAGRKNRQAAERRGND
jgi:hypothetical protein